MATNWKGGLILMRETFAKELCPTLITPPNAFRFLQKSDLK